MPLVFDFKLLLDFLLLIFRQHSLERLWTHLPFKERTTCHLREPSQAILQNVLRWYETEQFAGEKMWKGVMVRRNGKFVFGKISVCVCVWILLYHMQAQTYIHTFFDLRNESRAGGWSVLQMSPSNEDASVAHWGRSIHVPANKTVDFCSFKTLFAWRKKITFFRTISRSSNQQFLSSFGNLRVVRWHGIELVREPSCIAPSYSLEVLCTVPVWHRTDSGAFMCCIGMTLSCICGVHALMTLQLLWSL